MSNDTKKIMKREIKHTIDPTNYDMNIIFTEKDTFIECFRFLGNRKSVAVSEFINWVKHKYFKK